MFRPMRVRIFLWASSGRSRTKPADRTAVAAVGYCWDEDALPESRAGTSRAVAGCHGCGIADDCGALVDLPSANGSGADSAGQYLHAARLHRSAADSDDCADAAAQQLSGTDEGELHAEPGWWAEVSSGQRAAGG